MAPILGHVSMITDMVILGRREKWGGDGRHTLTYCWYRLCLRMKNTWLPLIETNTFV